MTRKSTDLLLSTAPEWVEIVSSDFDSFLADHANCERKASALAMSLVVKYADRSAIIPTLIEVAQEELEHFRQVYTLMVQRKLRLVNDSQDPYVNQLLATMRHGREQRLIDRLLVASLVECRGAERFGLLAEHLGDRELQTFYTNLWRSEIKHGHQFAAMAEQLFPDQDIASRLQQLAAVEADIVRQLPLRPALH